MGQFMRKFQMEGDIANKHQPLMMSKNWSDYPFMWHRNIGSMFFRVSTKQACDRQTDRQNYDPQDRSSMAASRGKNRSITECSA